MTDDTDDTGFLDPNTWTWLHDEPVYRMYAGTLVQYECAVDEVDYLYFTRWMWAPLWRRNKLYFRRTTNDGPRGVNSKQKIETILLHRSILFKMTGGPPTDKHICCDHVDGNTLNNRRYNLQWLTKRQNSQKRNGIHVSQQNAMRLKG